MSAHRCLLFGVLFVTANTTSSATDFHVYYLGGQSNMDGYGYVDHLPADISKPLKSVPIFHGNTSPDDTPIDGKGLWTVACVRFVFNRSFHQSG